MTRLATAIKGEPRELMEVQIETFGRPSPLTSSELSEYRYRAERIQQLGQELDRIATSFILDQRVGRAA